MFGPRRKTAGFSFPILQENTSTKDECLGHRFGARVKSESKRKIQEGYHEHFFTDVVKNGVADKMRIRSGDQLVLINQKFAPRLDHNSVLDHISKVPVDSKTRFELVVLRRCTDERWEWIRTSVILVPEPNLLQYLIDEPFVRDLHYKNCYGSETKDTHIYTMKVTGTQLYLAIFDGQVRLELSKSGDEEKYNICLKTKCKLDEGTGEISYEACMYKEDLEDPRFKGFVHVTNEGGVSVTIQETPQWFLYSIKPGNRQAFEVLQVNKWLGCDVSSFGTRGRFSLKSDPYFFEAHASKHGQHAETHRLDERDAIVDSLEDCLFPSTENEVQNLSDNSPPQTHRQDIYIQASSVKSDDASCSSNTVSSTSNDGVCKYFSQTSTTSEPSINNSKASLTIIATEEVLESSSDDVRSSGEKFSPELQTLSEDLLRQAVLQVCAHDNKKHILGTDTPDSGYGGHSRNSSDPEFYTPINMPRR